MHGSDFTRLGGRVADLFAHSGFKDIRTEAYSGLLIMGFLEDCVRGIGSGAGSGGAEYLAIDAEIREAVRAELHDLLEESKGEAVQVTVPGMFATGVR